MRKSLLWIGAALLVVAGLLFLLKSRPSEDRFTQLMTRGNGFLEGGAATNAIALYVQAIQLAPESVDAHLNLANAYLLAGDNQKAFEQCEQALSLDRNS